MSQTFNVAAVKALFAAVTSKAQTLGDFERVTGHEPKKAPGNGLSCSIWVDAIAPDPAGSGLASVSGRVTLHARIMSNMLQEPQDDIDPNILAATCDLMAAFSAGFTLGGTVRDVDVLSVSAQAGYINQDNRLYRAMTIILPVDVDPLWDEVA